MLCGFGGLAGLGNGDHSRQWLHGSAVGDHAGFGGWFWKRRPVDAANLVRFGFVPRFGGDAGMDDGWNRRHRFGHNGGLVWPADRRGNGRPARLVVGPAGAGDGGSARLDGGWGDSLSCGFCHRLGDNR